jgi:hypothetical protein
MTGARGMTAVSPANRTGYIFARQQRDLAAKKKKPSDEVIDVAEIRREALLDGFGRGFEEGAQWVFGVMEGAGLDVDEILSLAADEDDLDADDDDDQGDEDGD